MNQTETIAQAAGDQTTPEVPAAIRQCGSCHRQQDAQGVWRPWQRPPPGMLVPDIVQCEQEDCKDLVAEALQREAQRRQRKVERRALRLNRKAESRNQKFETGRECRSPLPPEDEREHSTFNIQHSTANGDGDGGQKSMGKASRLPVDLERDFQASGAADSANKILLEFFRQRENFNVPFRSTDLEGMTARAGHPSSRMNNRAIWLREQFIPAGFYLDNDPNGSAWGLPNGSYYRLCRIEDATSLSEDKKYKLTHPEPEML